MAYATAADVQTVSGRVLTTEETALVERRLAQVERMLIRRIPDLDAKIAAEEIDAADVIDTEAEAVLRLVRNPRGIRLGVRRAVLVSVQPRGGQRDAGDPGGGVGTPRHQAESDVLHRPEPRGGWPVSLLNRGTETVKVFQEVQTPDTDSDGNTYTRAAKSVPWSVPWSSRSVRPRTLTEVSTPRAATGSG